MDLAMIDRRKFSEIKAFWENETNNNPNWKPVLASIRKETPTYEDIYTGVQKLL
jgi:hypothetical protein